MNDGFDRDKSEKTTERERITLFDDAELPAGELAPPPGYSAPRRYVSWQRILLEAMRLAAAIAAFAAIFYMLTSYRTDSGAAEPALTVAAEPGTAPLPDTGAENTAAPGETTGESAASVETVAPETLNIVNESGKTVEIPELGSGEYILSPLAAAAGDVRVIIIHSHTSERISENEGVAAAGERLAAMLNGAGIPAYHCAERQDRNGVIGAYSVMRDTLDGLLRQYPETVCVIDLHCSDTPSPLTITVGCPTFTGWRENLLLAVAVCREAEEISPCLRLLSGTLGQDSGVLSLHAGICGSGYTAEEASGTLDALYRAIVAISGTG